MLLLKNSFKTTNSNLELKIYPQNYLDYLPKAGKHSLLLMRAVSSAFLDMCVDRTALPYNVSVELL